MKKEIIAIAILVASGIFTACTDASEDIIQNRAGQELEMTGGEEDPIDEEEEDPNPNSKKELKNTGGEDEQDPIEDPDKEFQKTGRENDQDPEEDPDEKPIIGMVDSTGGSNGGGNDHDPDPEPEERQNTGGEEDPIEEEDL